MTLTVAEKPKNGKPKWYHCQPVLSHFTGFSLCGSKDEVDIIYIFPAERLTFTEHMSISLHKSWYHRHKTFEIIFCMARPAFSWFWSDSNLKLNLHYCVDVDKIAQFLLFRKHDSFTACSDERTLSISSISSWLVFHKTDRQRPLFVSMLRDGTRFSLWEGATRLIVSTVVNSA